MVNYYRLARQLVGSVINKQSLEMAKDTKKELEYNDCFIIMPIADPDGYEKGHFRRVYEDIFKIACIKADFNPISDY
ncbi:MAG: hypothetical protein EOO43_20685 [Flavobacterium sp.]|nr:MAG: hypothetical protein EOO43_20685 [Flavobacterium sp.]